MDYNQTFTQLINEGMRDVQDGASQSNEDVKVITVEEVIHQRETRVRFKVIGVSGRVYDTPHYTFPGLKHPYYRTEALKSALAIKWAGTHTSKRYFRKMEFMSRYGSTHIHYLNRSLKKVYWLKKCFFPILKNRGKI